MDNSLEQNLGFRLGHSRGVRLERNLEPVQGLSLRASQELY